MYVLIPEKAQDFAYLPYSRRLSKHFFCYVESVTKFQKCSSRPLFSRPFSLSKTSDWSTILIYFGGNNDHAQDRRTYLKIPNNQINFFLLLLRCISTTSIYSIECCSTLLETSNLNYEKYNSHSFYLSCAKDGSGILDLSKFIAIDKNFVVMLIFNESTLCE